MRLRVASWIGWGLRVRQTTSGPSERRSPSAGYPSKSRDSIALTSISMNSLRFGARRLNNPLVSWPIRRRCSDCGSKFVQLRMVWVANWRACRKPSSAFTNGRGACIPAARRRLGAAPRRTGPTTLEPTPQETRARSPASQNFAAYEAQQPQSGESAHESGRTSYRSPPTCASRRCQGRIEGEAPAPPSA
jgi:hypothetical protein